jgi:hypothetical protein
MQLRLYLLLAVVVVLYENVAEVSMSMLRKMTDL